MSECPVCHQQIEIPEANRGTLFACPRCNAVYFVSWDGVPEIPPGEDEMNSTPEPTAFATPPEISIESPVEQEWSTPQPEEGGNFGTPETDFNSPSEFSPGEFNSQNDFSGGTESPNDAIVTTEEVSIELAAADFPEQPAGYDFNMPLGENPLFNPDAAIPEAELPSLADAPTFEDVTDFGNSDTASGPLSYTVVIEGIDTGKIYGELKEALDDSRFRWNVPELLKTIRAGRLEIKDMNPAKAFMLINRIKYLSLKISWRQDVLS